MVLEEVYLKMVTISLVIIKTVNVMVKVNLFILMEQFKMATG